MSRLFSQNFTKTKHSENGDITLPFIDVGKSCSSLGIFNIVNIYFIGIHENKILAKISEFTVCHKYCFYCELKEREIVLWPIKMNTCV